jgi:hypothetical protein
MAALGDPTAVGRDRDGSFTGIFNKSRADVGHTTMGTIRALFAKADERIVRTIVSFERQESEHWWKGILAGLALFFLTFGVIGAIPSVGILASGIRYLFVFVLALAWGILLLSIFLDAKYVREYSEWEPALGLYLAVLLFFPFAGPLAGGVYLYNRHRFVGVP